MGAGWKPVMAVPGLTPRSCPITDAPSFVTVVPARTAKFEAVASGTGDSKVLAPGPDFIRLTALGFPPFGEISIWLHPVNKNTEAVATVAKKFILLIVVKDYFPQMRNRCDLIFKLQCCVPLKQIMLPLLLYFSYPGAGTGTTAVFDAWTGSLLKWARVYTIDKPRP